MEVLSDDSARAHGSPLAASGSAVTIGAFDGVHLGHLAVLGELRRCAAARSYPTVVVTFDRHPATVIRPESAPDMLTDLDQKLEILAASGEVDYVLVLRFDAERAQEEAEDFVTAVLVGSLNARLIVVGEDFHFGRRRRGNVALLRDMGAELGFDVVGLGLTSAAAGTAGEGTGEPVSSTAIRRLLEEGEVADAALLLGRPYELRGVVAAGDRRGRDLGFPTANIDIPAGVLVPADGVYAGWYARPDGATHQAAVSLGRRPTFFGGSAAGGAVLEAHLLDFDGDLYGEAARLRFVSRLRGQERFGSADDLVAQTARDVEATRRLLPAG